MSCTVSVIVVPMPHLMVKSLLLISWQSMQSAHHQIRALGAPVTLSVSQNPLIFLHAAVS